MQIEGLNDFNVTMESGQGGISNKINGMNANSSQITLKTMNPMNHNSSTGENMVMMVPTL